MRERDGCEWQCLLEAYSPRKRGFRGVNLNEPSLTHHFSSRSPDLGGLPPRPYASRRSADTLVPSLLDLSPFTASSLPLRRLSVGANIDSRFAYCSSSRASLTAYGTSARCMREATTTAFPHRKAALIDPSASRVSSTGPRMADRRTRANASSCVVVEDRRKGIENEKLTFVSFPLPLRTAFRMPCQTADRATCPCIHPTAMQLDLHSPRPRPRPRR